MTDSDNLSTNDFACSDCGWTFTRQRFSVVLDSLDRRQAEREFKSHDCAKFERAKVSS
jgi:hypothetical protein